MEIGSWAEIIAALGALAAAVVSVFALKTAIAANRTAEETREEARDVSEQTLRRETLRQHADVARQLQAWWVVWREDEEKKFGILVTNAGEGATVFRDVRVETTGNANAKGTRGHITFTSLPPGSYVLTSTSVGSDAPWSEPQIARSDVAYEPLVKAQKYSVTCIWFEDPTKRAWKWTPARGLETASAADTEVAAA